MNERAQVEYENHLDPRVITDDKIQRRFRACSITIPVLRSLWLDDISSIIRQRYRIIRRIGIIDTSCYIVKNRIGLHQWKLDCDRRGWQIETARDRDCILILANIQPNILGLSGTRSIVARGVSAFTHRSLLIDVNVGAALMYLR
jgi:hypothetical protein